MSLAIEMQIVDLTYAYAKLVLNERKLNAFIVNKQHQCHFRVKSPKKTLLTYSEHIFGLL